MGSRKRTADGAPTIRDIARRAGVSVSSVSRALNDYPDIKPETKAHILRIAEELRYWPNAAAKNLATARTFTVGVFFDPEDASGLRHPFVSHVLTVFAATVGQAGYDVLWFVNRRAPFDRWSLLDRVRHRTVDGVFLIGRPDDSVDDLVAAEVPLVGLDFSLTGPRVGTITSDNRTGMRSLVEHLAGAGYTRLAYLYGPLERPPFMERLQGFYSACQQLGLSVRPEWVLFGGFNRESGRRATQTLLEGAERPDAILAASDSAAFGVLAVLREHGIRVPDDVGVAGFDDIEDAQFAVPPLTTVAQDKDAMGRIAGEVLIEMMQEDEPTRPHHYVLPTALRVRASTMRGTGSAPPANAVGTPARA
jgi:LacI family transcriptional regulator